MNGTSRNGWGAASSPVNGASARHVGTPRVDIPRPAMSRATAPDDMRWKPLYERASVERFVADTEAECARLQSEIEVARAQRDAARQIIAARELEAQAELGALVFAYERDMTELEAAHQQVLATIRDAAEAETARIRAAAEREVAGLRQMIVTLAPLVMSRSARSHVGEQVQPAVADAGAREQADAG